MRPQAGLRVLRYMPAVVFSVLARDRPVRRSVPVPHEIQQSWRGQSRSPGFGRWCRPLEVLWDSVSSYQIPRDFTPEANPAYGKEDTRTLNDGGAGAIMSAELP